MSRKQVASAAVAVVMSAIWADGTAAAQSYPPYVTSTTNSASYTGPGITHSGVARGSIFVIFGYGLGPQTLQQTGSYPLGNSLAGTSVHITIGNVSTDVPVLYTSFRQVAALMPSAVPAGSGYVVVTYNGQPSGPAPLAVVENSFGIYSQSSNGQGSGVITTPAYGYRTLEDSAKPGDVMIIWGTGLGPVDGDDSAGPLPGNKFANTEVWVGGQPAKVSYAGRSGCCAGLDQIVFNVPTGISGCFVPVAVRSGAVVSNFLTLPIAPQGGQCTDPVGIPRDVLARAESNQPVSTAALLLGPVPILDSLGFQFAGVMATRLSAMLKTPVSELDVKRLVGRSTSAKDKRALIEKYKPAMKAVHVSAAEVMRTVNDFTRQGAAAEFHKLSGLRQVVAQFSFFLPPPGSCVSLTSWVSPRGQWGTTNEASDAGSELLLNGPVGLHSLAKSRQGRYSTFLGSGFSSTKLPGGTYTISGTGGRDVGAFTAQLDNSQGLVWIDKSLVTRVDRSQPMTVKWSGGTASEYVLFGGTSMANDHQQVFTCVAAASQRQLTVPTYVLSTLEPTTEAGYFFVLPHPLSTPFTSAGVDLGEFIDAGTEYIEVPIR